MKRIFALMLAFTPVVALAGPTRIAIDDSHAVSLEPPPGWTVQAGENVPGVPNRNIEVSNGRASMRVTFLVSQPGGPLDRATDKGAAMDAVVRQGAQQYVADSVEGAIKVQSLDSGSQHFRYAQFTDKTYNSATASPTNFKYITSGMFVEGKVIAAVTFVSNSLTDQDYQGGITLIRSFHAAP